MVFQFQPGSSIFHRLDPLTKFFWLICVSVLVLSFESAWIQMVLLGAVVVTGMLLADVPMRLLWRGMKIPLLFGIPYFILQLLFLPGETPLVQIGTYTLTLEALDFAAAVTIRFMTLVLASMLYIVSTDPRDVVLALAQKLRVPYRFAFAISIALRFLPILGAEAEVIRSAQWLRGYNQAKGMRNRLLWQRQYVVAIFVQAARRVQQTAHAMEAKGFGAFPDRTYIRSIQIGKSGIMFAALSGILTVGLLISHYLC